MEVITKTCIICEVDVSQLTRERKVDNNSGNLKYEFIEENVIVNFSEVKLGLQLFWKLLEISKTRSNFINPLLKITEKDNEVIKNFDSENLSCCEHCWIDLEELLRLQRIFEEIQKSILQQVENLKISLLTGSNKDTNSSSSNSIRDELITRARKTHTLSSSSSTSQKAVIRPCSVFLTRLSPATNLVTTQTTVKHEESEEYTPNLSDLEDSNNYTSENELSNQIADPEFPPVKKRKRGCLRTQKTKEDSKSKKKITKLDTNQKEYFLRLSDNLLLYKNTLIEYNYGNFLQCLEWPTFCKFLTNGTNYESFEEMKHHIKSTHLTNNDSSKARKCPECDKEITNLELWTDHLITCYINQPVYICPSCWKPLKSKDGLKLHQWTHKNSEEKANQDQPSSLKQKRDDPDRFYDCHFDGCGKKFKKRQLKAHLTTHLPKHVRKKFECPECPKIYYTAVAVRGHIEREHNKNLMRFRYCPVCNKQYNWRNGSNFRVHVKSHTGENICVCETCGKSFMRKDSLKYHMEMCHQRKDCGGGGGLDKVFQCEFCEKRYSHIGGLKRHKRAVHE